ncbi:hypothetical protein VUR80DRAFT_8098 [Thermomyces stellatus]
MVVKGRPAAVPKSVRQSHREYSRPYERIVVQAVVSSSVPQLDQAPFRWAGTAIRTGYPSSSNTPAQPRDHPVSLSSCRRPYPLGILEEDTAGTAAGRGSLEGGNPEADTCPAGTAPARRTDPEAGRAPRSLVAGIPWAAGRTGSRSSPGPGPGTRAVAAPDGGRPEVGRPWRPLSRGCVSNSASGRCVNAPGTAPEGSGRRARAFRYGMAMSQVKRDGRRCGDSEEESLILRSDFGE